MENYIVESYVCNQSGKHVKTFLKVKRFLEQSEFYWRTILENDEMYYAPKSYFIKTD